MKAKTIPGAGAALTAVLLLSACGGGGGNAATTKEDNTLVIGRTTAVDGMSGDSCLGAGSISTMPMIYSSLLTNTPDGQGVQGGLAESYDYDPDALTYTFHLRDDAGFSNGDPVTAADVAFSFQEWTTGENSGGYYDMVASAEAVDDTTAVVHLTRPDTFLPALLTWCTSTIYPADYAGQTAEEFFTAPIGAGPFAFVSWENPGPSETIELERNEHYYGAADGQPGVDGITVRTSSDAGQLVLAYQSGEIDMLERISADDAGQLDSDQVVVTEPSSSLDLMVNSARPGLSEPVVRQAISAALDRGELASIQEGFAIPAVGVVPTNVPNAVGPTTPYVEDVAAAQQLIDSRTGTDPLSFRLGFETGDSVVATMAELIRDQLGRIGIDLTLEPVDSVTVFSQGADGDFDLLITGVSAISPTVFDPLSFLLVAWYPWTGADAAVLTEQFTLGTSTTDDAVKDAAVRAIQDDAQAQSTVIGLTNQSAAYAVADYVTGFTATPALAFDAGLISVETAE
jgi:peptide/nickel transport system substrate-binding protein